MQPPPIDTKPPVGNADVSDAAATGGGGIKGIMKMMFIQFVHGQIQKMKIP